MAEVTANSFSGKSINDLSESDLVNWMKQQDSLFEDIISGKILSERHTIFHCGPPKLA